MTTATAGSAKVGPLGVLVAFGALALAVGAAGGLGSSGPHVSQADQPKAGSAPHKRAQPAPTVAETAYADIPGNPCPRPDLTPYHKVFFLPVFKGFKKLTMGCLEWHHILTRHPSYGDSARAILECITKTLQAPGNVVFQDARTLILHWKWGSEWWQVSKVFINIKPSGIFLKTATNSVGEGFWTSCARGILR